MIASLPMYDRPSNQTAHDTLWALIRDALRHRDIPAPDRLNRDIDHVASWGHPDLVLGQICNLPYRAQFREQVTLIGAADYGLEGCKPGQYASVIIIHRDADDLPAKDALQTQFACNDLLSQSGFGAAWAMLNRDGIALHPTLITGAHSASLTAVANGQAECATIDAQTWRMLLRDDPLAQEVRVIGTTPASPGMSFITRKGQNPVPYFAAIQEAIANLPEATSANLDLKGIVDLPNTDYDFAIPEIG
jgi:ABC-type phosphate/phosphonate transport system substrate-binding protein